ncbi:conserved hypothetical protein [Nostocoides jenkinsii Ben 74]|uniref:DUF5926 domain-containing protein n=2 Tax=Nostocoides jenkinsii TaxID=330834 RepID=A0A077MBK3_9MICO|nr:conserved hypothetical protein [Tetrasphaera jenkinsii Ben 74]
MPGEPDWVALKEILPAATVTVPLAGAALVEGGPSTVTIATVLPMAWPALRRGDGAVLIATQGGPESGDASRDLASALLAALAVEPGTPLMHVPLATDATPALAELIDISGAPDLQVHEGFDFWVEGQELEGDARESLERANASAVPTTKLAGVDSAFWCLLGGRPHLRLVLPDDEDVATDTLARLYAAGAAGLGEGSRLLGAFRAGGLLIPVWELAAGSAAADCEPAAAEFVSRYAAARTDEPLTGEERRAKNGLLSRQVTLR